jgi:hypothetical protein
MPTTRIGTINDAVLTAFNPVAGTPTGSRISIPSPMRGQLMEAGFMPASLVASAMTMAVAIGAHDSLTISNFTNVITSTLGTFSSLNLPEGSCASVVPASPTFLNQGDAIQFTTSGGNASQIGATVYAIIRGL